MNSMGHIDELDRNILKIITNNARTPFKDVAAECHVSRAAVHQHVQKLYDNGVITGSGFQVDPKMLGYNLCLYVGITLEKGSMYKAVTAELQKIPQVVESVFTLGAFSIIIKLYARDDRHLMELLNGKIQCIPGISRTESLTVLETGINRQLPID